MAKQIEDLTTEEQATFRSEIGAAAAADLASKQPLASDLTAIAALTTTTHGRSLLTDADAAASRAKLVIPPRTEYLRNTLNDLDSRTKDDEGRRIEEIDGGWLLLNHQKYREMASRDEQREAEAKRKARYRAKVKRNEASQNVPDKSRDVPKNLHIADTDTKADTEAKKEKNIPPNPQGGFSLKVEDSEKQDPTRIEVGKLLGRRESTKWSNEEIRLLKTITPIHPNDMAMMQDFYGAEIPKETDYRRTTIERLLKHWNGELDKARAWQQAKR